MPPARRMASPEGWPAAARMSGMRSQERRSPVAHWGGKEAKERRAQPRGPHARVGRRPVSGWSRSVRRLAQAGRVTAEQASSQKERLSEALPLAWAAAGAPGWALAGVCASAWASVWVSAWASAGAGGWLRALVGGAHAGPRSAATRAASAAALAEGAADAGWGLAGSGGRPRRRCWRRADVTSDILFNEI